MSFFLIGWKDSLLLKTLQKLSTHVNLLKHAIFWTTGGFAARDLFVHTKDLLIEAIRHHGTHCLLFCSWTAWTVPATLIARADEVIE